METIRLYEGAMQVVPLLLIALFIDNGAKMPTPRGRLERLVVRTQDRVFAVLGIVAFFVSMFVLGGILTPSRVTDAIVIAALSGAIGLLFSAVWQRFAHRKKIEA